MDEGRGLVLWAYAATAATTALVAGYYIKKYYFAEPRPAQKPKDVYIAKHLDKVKKWKPDSMNIIMKPCEKLPVAIDIPRLAKNVVVGGKERILNTPELLLAIADLLKATSEAKIINEWLENEDPAESNNAIGLKRLLPKLPDTGGVAGVIKIINQAAIAPITIAVQFSMGGGVCDVKGGW
eukprot:CAMPEP_0168508600 /NCGR_PEP_ID=MMETSP0405-20121227/224_1 /TAXON_ID=498012 /ORGANISM="Trichosphaerium sp, Strain Am-I-7 wt" /LENGTH=180 /DNA_ID=CAMNT_0008525793 /DNA_START=200 /DNA_END=739 /DNA_ORIENTATION=+